MPPEVDGIEVRPGKAETNLLESLQPPPATAGAPSPQQPGTTPDPAVPKGADAAFLDQLFAVGNASMSGDDILSTIETIQAMEAIIISSLERQLKSPPLQTRAKRGTLKKIFDPKDTRTVPGPDNKPRTIEVQSPLDHIPSVQERVFSQEEVKKLKALLKDLPLITPSDGAPQKASDFQSRLTRVLYQIEVPLYQVRELLPIKESGSMIPLSRDATTKEAPVFTPVVSNDLLAKARSLGLLDDE